MVRTTKARTGLLIGSAGFALAAALVAAPEEVRAQAFEATPTVAQGTATFDRATPGEETVTVSTPTAVIDWTPNEDNLGNALDFLPTGNTATFQDSPGQGGFAVLNRILPATNGNIAVFDGTVISRLQSATGTFAPGGFVAFYSPTGILVGSNAVFDVGQLLLTTQNPDLASFDSFATAGGTLNLLAGPDPTARVQIDPGASITSSVEGGYFVAAAPQIIQGGTVNVNGSVAYIASEQTNLTYSNGLFDIVIPAGTTVSNAIEHTGTTTGPASSGAGDNHVIYAVARAATNPIQMLFQGNLGFAPATVAGVENGDVILAANYDVFGKTVAGTNIDFGSSLAFVGNDETSTVQADIFVDAMTATSDLLAASSHTTQINAAAGASSFSGDLLVSGRQSGQVIANGFDLTVGGDLVVASTRYGEVNTGPTGLDATAGDASITIVNGSSVTVNGSTRVDASAFAGVDDGTLTGGSATAGLAQVNVDNGTLQLNGGLSVLAEGSFFQGTGQTVGGAISGGFGFIQMGANGFLSVTGDTLVSTSATGADVSAGTTSGTQANGGEIQVAAFGGGINFNGNLSLNNVGVAGAGGGAGIGASGIGGGTFLQTGATGGTIDVTGSATLISHGIGATMANGTGGTGIGGGARIIGNGGTMNLGSAQVFANGEGGAGANGGDGIGGIAGILSGIGSITIGGFARATAVGYGGNASGLGGFGGSGFGGLTFLQANGTLIDNASLSIGGDAFLDNSGFGGQGGVGDGASGIAAGNGGEGRGGAITDPNAHDSNFTNGAYLLAQGDRGTLSVVGSSFVNSFGVGGQGGTDTTGQAGGTGGSGTGGTAQAGLFVGGGDGSVAQGSASFADLTIISDGRGGSGGFGADGTISGIGGDGAGFGAFLTSRAGILTAGNVSSSANGTGGAGSTGGTGTGGTSALIVNVTGTTNIGSHNSGASGFGGTGLSGNGGAGTGGASYIDNQDGTLQITGTTTLAASGLGGQSTGGNGGAGTGGAVDIANSTGVASTSDLTGVVQMIANGTGGAVLSGGGTGGLGTGGTAQIDLNAGATLALGSLQTLAFGFGGSSADGDGGDGTGGTAQLLADGTGTTVTVALPVDFATLVPNSNAATIGAIGIGGSTGGGAGIGGAGTGGTARLSVTAGASVTLPNDPNQQITRILARGNGGSSSVDGGTGGFGLGGSIDILVDASTLDAPNLLPSTFSQGGQVTGPNGNGGSARGGDRSIRILNGSLFTVSSPGGGSGAVGANGTGTGNGGDAEGGTATIDIDNSTVNITGRLAAFTGASGGAGQVGGDAIGGTSRISIVNGSTVTTTPDINGFQALGVEGVFVEGGTGVVQGGSATGSTAILEITDSTFSGALSVNGFTNGGAATAGTGGSAVGGTVSATFDNSNVTLVGETSISSQAQGGQGTTAGGDAQAGTAQLGVGGSQLTFDPFARLTVRTLAKGGQGAQVGDAIGGNSTAAFTGSTVSGGELFVEVDADASADFGTTNTGGTATAGDAQLVFVNTGTVDLARVALTASAFTSQGGSATGGLAFFDADGAGSPTISITDLTLDANGADDGTGGTTTAGNYTVSLTGGDVSVGTFLANATGTQAGGTSSLSATGGSLLVSNSLISRTTGDIDIETANGNIIGGPSVAAPTANVTIDSGGTITIAGDNDNAISFGGQSLTLFSSQLDILAGARIGAETVRLRTRATGAPAIFGGDTEEAGYTLTQAEGARIEAGSVIVTVAEDASLTGPDAIIRDITIEGSLADGPGSVTITSTGHIRVEGNLNYTAAGADDSLTVNADQRLEIITPTGSISMTGLGDELAGTLTLSSNNIVAAALDLAEQLALDPNFEGRDAALQENPGPVNLDGAIRANAVTLAGNENIFIQNTGTSTDFAGVTVGGGGLIIGRLVPGGIGSGGEINPDGVSFVGVLATPDEVLLFTFTLDSTKEVTLRTFSYAGGTNSAGQVIPSGGFDPILALFDAVGNLIDQNDDGGTNVPSDPNTGLNYDTFLQTTLEPGEYQVAVSVFPNFANGPTLDDGFSGASSFGDRTANFAFDVIGADAVAGPGQTGGPLTVFAFGRRQNADGTTVTGADFFNQIDFGIEGGATFTEGSAFNTCLIPDGCGGTSSPIPEEAPPITNPSVVTAAVTSPITVAPVEAAEEEVDVTFGESFPTLLDTPLLTINPLIDDPVTSGGDAALYSLAEDPEDEDEDDEDEEEDESGEE